MYQPAVTVGKSVTVEQQLYEQQLQSNNNYSRNSERRFKLQEKSHSVTL